MDQAEKPCPEYERFAWHWAIVIGCLAAVGLAGQVLLFRALTHLRAEQGQLQSERAEFAVRQLEQERAQRGTPGDVSRVEEELRRLELAVDSLTRRKKDAEEQAAATEAALKTLREQEGDVRKDLRSSRQTLEDVEAAVRPLRAEWESLKAGIAHKKGLIIELEDQCAKLQAESAAAEGRLARKRQELERLSEQVKSTADDVADVEKRREAMSRQEVMLMMLRDEVYELQKRREGLQAEIKRMTADYGDLCARLRAISGKLGATEQGQQSGRGVSQ